MHRLFLAFLAVGALLDFNTLQSAHGQLFRDGFEPDPFAGVDRSRCAPGPVYLTLVSQKINGQNVPGRDLWRICQNGFAEPADFDRQRAGRQSAGDVIEQLLGSSTDIYPALVPTDGWFNFQEIDDGLALWPLTSRSMDRLVWVPTGGEARFVVDAEGAPVEAVGLGQLSFGYGPDQAWFVPFAGDLYFMNQAVLWRMRDGVAEIVDENPDAPGVQPIGFPARLTRFAGRLYFTAASGNGQGAIVLPRLMSIDADGKITQITDENLLVFSQGFSVTVGPVRGLIPHGEHLYFVAGPFDLEAEQTAAAPRLLYRVNAEQQVALVDVDASITGTQPLLLDDGGTLRATQIDDQLYMPGIPDDGTFTLFEVRLTGSVSDIDPKPDPNVFMAGSELSLGITAMSGLGDALYFLRGGFLERVTVSGVLQLVPPRSAGFAGAIEPRWIITDERIFFSARETNAAGDSTGSGVGIVDLTGEATYRSIDESIFGPFTPVASADGGVFILGRGTAYWLPAGSSQARELELPYPIFRTFAVQDDYTDTPLDRVFSRPSGLYAVLLKDFLMFLGSATDIATPVLFDPQSRTWLPIVTTGGQPLPLDLEFRSGLLRRTEATFFTADN